MGKYFLSFFLFIHSYPNVNLGNLSFDKIFPDEFKEANQFFISNKKCFKDFSIKSGNDPYLVTSLVFPELMRYSLISDFIESSVLEWVYAEMGSAAADFSIGRFQMKPSFAESVEDEILKSEELKVKYKNLLIPSSLSSIDQRRKRLIHLSNLQFQLLYLNAFVSICEIRFNSAIPLQTKDKVKLFSTAYNSGFLLSQEKLIQSSNQKLFPYGLKYKGTQYSYQEVSQYFFDLIKSKSVFGQ